MNVSYKLAEVGIRLLGAIESCTDKRRLKKLKTLQKRLSRLEIESVRAEKMIEELGIEDAPPKDPGFY